LHERLALQPLQVGELAADHLADQAHLAQLAGEVLPHELAVAQNRHPVGDLVDLVEEVRDEQDRDALLLQPPHHPKQLGDLVRVEAGGRLIEDQDFASMSTARAMATICWMARECVDRAAERSRLRRPSSSAARRRSLP
jgi:hypothetical protein